MSLSKFNENKHFNNVGIKNHPALYSYSVSSAAPNFLPTQNALVNPNTNHQNTAKKPGQVFNVKVISHYTRGSDGLATVFVKDIELYSAPHNALFYYPPKNIKVINNATGQIQDLPVTFYETPYTMKIKGINQPDPFFLYGPGVQQEVKGLTSVSGYFYNGQFYPNNQYVVLQGPSQNGNFSSNYQEGHLNQPNVNVQQNQIIQNHQIVQHNQIVQQNQIKINQQITNINKQIQQEKIQHQPSSSKKYKGQNFAPKQQFIRSTATNDDYKPNQFYQKNQFQYNKNEENRVTRDSLKDSKLHSKVPSGYSNNNRCDKDFEKFVDAQEFFQLENENGSDKKPVETCLNSGEKKDEKSSAKPNPDAYLEKLAEINKKLETSGKFDKLVENMQSSAGNEATKENDTQDESSERSKLSIDEETFHARLLASQKNLQSSPLNKNYNTNYKSGSPQKRDYGRNGGHFNASSDQKGHNAYSNHSPGQGIIRRLRGSTRSKYSS